MKTYTGSPWQRLDPELRDALAPIDRFLREVGPAFQRISLGQNPEGSGATLGSPRLGVSDADTALVDYLYLPGRTSGAQTVNGDVIFAGNVTLSSGAVLSGAVSLTDSLFSILDDVDPTKILQLQLSGITTGTTRTLTVPNASGTLPLLSLAQTWSALQTFDAVPLAGPVIDINTVGPGGGVPGDGSGFMTFTDSSSGFKAELQIVFSTGLTADRAIQIPDGDGQIVLAAANQTLSNKTFSTTSNVLRCNSTSIGVSFADNANTSKKLRFILSGASANNHTITLTNTAARNYGLGNLSGNIAIVGDDPPTVAAGALGKVDLTGQSADITTTNLSSTPPAGFYEVEAVLLCTASDAGAGTLTLTIGWTDTLGATTDATVTLALTATGRAKLDLPIQVASGDITYAVTGGGTYGTARFAIYIRVISLG